jgi:hypothetical protein
MQVLNKNEIQAINFTARQVQENHYSHMLHTSTALVSSLCGGSQCTIVVPIHRATRLQSRAWHSPLAAIAVTSQPDSSGSHQMTQGPRWTVCPASFLSLLSQAFTDNNILQRP